MEMKLTRSVHTNFGGSKNKRKSTEKKIIKSSNRIFCPHFPPGTKSNFRCYQGHILVRETEMNVKGAVLYDLC